MRDVRVIARLDIKSPNLIKGIRLEGLRKLGDPQPFVESYYAQGIDEICYMDIVASLYDRNSLEDLLRKTAENIFVPLTVGGGIRTVENAATLLQSGADKVAINTAAIRNPDLIRQISERFGSQCMVLSIEAKSTTLGKWTAFTDNGREHTNRDVIEWVQEAVELGVGEILLTSVDQEGTQKGFDLELCRAVTNVVEVPVILSGGLGSLDDAKVAVSHGKADAIAVAHALHYNKFTVAQLKNAVKGAQSESAA
ncbi:imidazole glycerol phosphate synthase subunit HisF [bacterium]|jgi:imidazole glycerol-phosphate synthase subunit HisF|nr:imidazole glycerol phosphate synthase subunit HisF [bacterium]